MSAPWKLSKVFSGLLRNIGKEPRVARDYSLRFVPKPGFKLKDIKIKIAFQELQEIREILQCWVDRIPFNLKNFS